MPDDAQIRELLDLATSLATLEQRLQRKPGETDCELAAALASLAAEAERLAATARSAAARPLRPPADHGHTAPLARPRLLLIDDEIHGLQALASLLDQEFEVIASSDGLDGLRRARSPLVDAVVTDLHMPGIDGIGILRLLRADPATADVPCLLLTADDATMEKLHAFGLGAADYVTKPVDETELAARLHHRIREARLLRNERLLKETDELTGLPNRRALSRRLTEACARASVEHRPVCLGLVDADHLKAINDTWGHPEGDRAIKAVARALEQCRRTNDFAARLGGDEFAMLLPATDLEGAERLLVRVQELLDRSPLEIAGTKVALHVSHGLAELRDGDDGWERLFARADEALYACKRRRR